MPKYTKILDEFDLASMRDRLNETLGTGGELSRIELSEIRRLVERLAAGQQPPTETSDKTLKPIAGFTTLKALRHGRLWYIVDNTYTDMPAHRRTIGGYHTSFGACCSYADLWYRGQFL